MLVIPPTAPFSIEQIGWLNGYLAARMQAPSSSSSAAAAPPVPAVAPPQGKPVSIIWGSQTGTCETLAKKASKKLSSAGHSVTVLDMSEVEAETLTKTENLFVITSTYGDGEPPDNAGELHKLLLSDSGPNLSSLNFSVLGLGDSSYPDFNQCAKEFDSALEKLGGKRLSTLVESDVDYDDPFDQWLSEASAALA